jgi:hypothetical protein
MLSMTPVGRHEDFLAPRPRGTLSLTYNVCAQSFIIYICLLVVAAIASSKFPGLRGREEGDIMFKKMFAGFGCLSAALIWLTLASALDHSVGFSAHVGRPARPFVHHHSAFVHPVGARFHAHVFVPFPPVVVVPFVPVPPPAIIVQPVPLPPPVVYAPAPPPVVYAPAAASRHGHAANRRGSLTDGDVCQWAPYWPG